MMEQMDMFSLIPTEEWVFETLRPYLVNVLCNNNAGECNLKRKQGNDYSSVMYLKHDPYDNSKKPVQHLCFRIRCRNNHNYFEVSSNVTESLSLPIYHGLYILTEGFYRFDFVPTSSGVLEHTDFLCKVLEKVIDSIPKDFDCCSRYEECSDCRKCINPNPALAVGCGYRRILKSGRIYYGKNRNI